MLTSSIFANVSDSFLYLKLSFSVNADTEGCEHNWRKFHGHCYRYFTRRHTWEDAEKDCREHSGHLASIHSMQEQDFINGQYLLNLNKCTNKVLQVQYACVLLNLFCNIINASLMNKCIHFFNKNVLPTPNL